MTASGAGTGDPASAVTSTPPSGGTGTSGPSPAPARTPFFRPEHQKYLRTGAAVAVLVAILLGALWIGGIGPFAPAGPDHGPRTYSKAVAETSSAISGYDHTSWSPVVAGAVAPSGGFSVSVPDLANSSLLAALTNVGCTVQVATHAPTTVAAPPTSSSNTNGSMDLWVFVYRNGSGGMLIVLDQDGTITPAATLGGTECALLGGVLQALPGSPVDSPAAVRTALAHGGSAFLSTHPGANLSLGLTGAFSIPTVLSQPSRWTLVISDCSVLGSANGTTGAAWRGTVDSASGNFVTSNTSMVNCSFSGRSSLKLPVSGLGGLDRPMVPAVPPGLGRWGESTPGTK